MLQAGRAGPVQTGQIHAIRQREPRVDEVPEGLQKIGVPVEIQLADEADHGRFADPAGLGQLLGGHEDGLARVLNDEVTQDSPLGRQGVPVVDDLLDHRVGGMVGHS